LATNTERTSATAALFAPPQLESNVLANLDAKVAYRLLPLDSIAPNPEQPRRAIDETSQAFEDLVGTIRSRGLLQPVVVDRHQMPDGRYLLVAGERRLRAFCRLRDEDPRRWAHIAAIIREGSRDEPEAELLMAALTENMAREDLSDAERAEALTRLRGMIGCTQEELAQRLGMTVGRVQQFLALGRFESVRVASQAGELTQQQAVMLGRTGDEAVAEALVPAVAGMTVNETADVVRAVKAAGTGLPPGARVQAAITRTRTRGGVSRSGFVFPSSQADALEDIMLSATPFILLKPGIASIPRADLVAIMQSAAEQLNIWPRQRPVHHDTGDFPVSISGQDETHG
jgi:ParB family transcriptional regulator, chromosome partitioning protein